jgi:flagellar hook assembly protein FlgD
MAVYDATGRRVRTLLDEDQPAGARDVTWNGQDDRGNPVASGVYFYKMTAGKFSQTRRMVLLK